MASSTCLNPGCALEGKLMCSKCEQARYCSASCQRSHWGAHKAGCKVLAAAKASSAAADTAKPVVAATDHSAKVTSSVVAPSKKSPGSNSSGSTSITVSSSGTSSLLARAGAREGHRRSEKEVELPPTGSVVDVSWYKRPRNANEDAKASERLFMTVSHSIAEKIERDSRCECCAGYRDLDVGYMQHLWGDCFQSAQRKEKKGKGIDALIDYMKCLEISYQLDQMIQDVEDGKREHSQRGKDIIRAFFAEIGDRNKPEPYLFRFFANVLLARVTVGLIPCAARLGLRLIAKEQVKYCRAAFLFDAAECAVEGNLEPADASTTTATTAATAATAATATSSSSSSSAKGGAGDKLRAPKQLTTPGDDHSSGDSSAVASPRSAASDESGEERYKPKLNFLQPPTTDRNREDARRVRETSSERKLMGLFLDDLSRLEKKFLCKKRGEASLEQKEHGAEEGDDSGMMETDDDN